MRPVYRLLSVKSQQNSAPWYVRRALVHSLLSAESQQCLSFLYEVSIKVITGTFPK